MSDYSKYERKFDWNLADLEHNKITIGEYEKQFRAIVDEIREDAIDEYNRELKAYIRRLSVHYVSDEDFNYIAEKLKEQKE